MVARWVYRKEVGRNRAIKDLVKGNSRGRVQEKNPNIRKTYLEGFIAVVAGTMVETRTRNVLYLRGRAHNYCYRREDAVAVGSSDFRDEKGVKGRRTLLSLGSVV